MVFLTKYGFGFISFLEPEYFSKENTLFWHLQKKYKIECFSPLAADNMKNGKYTVFFNSQLELKSKDSQKIILLFVNRKPVICKQINNNKYENVHCLLQSFFEFILTVLVKGVGYGVER